MSDWAVWQFDPGLPAEGDEPAIPGSPPVILARGYATEDDASEAIDERFGDRFNVGTARVDTRWDD